MDLYNEKQALITHINAILEAMTLVKITRIGFLSGLVTYVLDNDGACAM
jgi:hypothetical protein